MTLKLYDPEAEADCEPVMPPGPRLAGLSREQIREIFFRHHIGAPSRHQKGEPLMTHAADDQVPFEVTPRWACVVAPGCSYYFRARPCLWVRFWQRLLLGWRWVDRRS